MKKYVVQDIDEHYLGNLSNKSQDFEGTPLDIFNFRIAGYSICKNWLIARNGRPLNNEDAQQYQRIVMVLKEMVKLMEEIKTAIERNHLNKLELVKKVQTIVVEKLGIDPASVNPVKSFANDLWADSLGTVEIVMALEEAFDIKIFEQVAEKLLTVQKVIDYISQKLDVAV